MLTEFPYWFEVGVAVSLGLAFGSFLNVVIYRLPRGQNVAYPASRCPGCGKAIAAYDNVPVLSWLWLRGIARCCGTNISPRYPLIELTSGLVGWAVLEKIRSEVPGDAPAHVPLLLFAAYLALCLGLLAAIFVDLEFMLLPDEITIGGAVLGVLSAPLRQISWSDSLVGAALGFLLVWLPFHVIYRLVRGHPGMGLGDAKLLALAGAWLGWRGAVFALLAGAVQGTVVAVVVLLVKGRIEEPEAVTLERRQLKLELEALEGEARRLLEDELKLDPLMAEAEAGIGKVRLPFGPFLVIATLEYLFFGEALLDGYLRILWTP